MTRTARGRRSTDGAAKRARGSQRTPAKAAPTPKDTTSPDKADRESPRQRTASAWHSFLHDRSVRSRVAALVLLPLLCTLVLGALFFRNALNDAGTAGRVEHLASVSQTATELLYRVQDERDRTGLLDVGAIGAGPVSDARAATDTAIEALNAEVEDLRDGDLGDTAANAVVSYDREVSRLPGYRAQRDIKTPAFDVSGAAAYHRLADAVRGIITAAGSVVDDPSSARLIRALDDISQATESASMERGLMSYFIPNLVSNPATGTAAVQRETAAVLQGEQDLLIGRFLEGFDDLDQARAYSNRIIIGDRAIATTRSDINIGIAPREAPEAWFENATTRLQVMRGIETETSDQVVAEASSATDSARLSAIISALVVLLVLALTIVMTLVVARSIVGPLRRLRVAALDAAKNELPALVDRIHRDGPAAARNAKDAVVAEGRDEIGQVATAFNNVHSTAVDVAGQQALLRQNLDTIVVNLSRRTQSLVDRQLGEIEGLESRERDPDQLSTLFRIDHLATRVRRHAESLLVLAGVEEMRKHGAASPVLDVVRTAVGEVEQYPRVRFGVMPTDLVASAAVDDVAHLLAELIDNSTEFSAPSTPVNVTSQPLLGGGLRLQVTDSGLGIPADQLDSLNVRLNNPGDIDVAASRTLGLYVVARLSKKHGIKVRLEPGVSGGTVAQVDLPAHLILSPLDTTEGVIPAVSAEPEPPQPQTPAPAPMPTPTPAPSVGQPFGADDGLSPYLPSRPEREAPVASAPSSPPAALPPVPTGLPRRGADRPAPPETPASPPTSTPPVPDPAPVASWPVRDEPAPSRPAPARPTAPVASADTNGTVTAGSTANGTAGGDNAHGTGSDDTGHGLTPDRSPAPEHNPSTTGQQRAVRPPVGREVQSTHTPVPSLRAPEPSLPDGDSPIYESVRSAWFSKGDAPRDWTSPADEGWRRAAEALRSAEEAASARRVQREAQATVDTAPVPRAQPQAQPRQPEMPRREPQRRDPQRQDPQRRDPQHRGPQRHAPTPEPAWSASAASAPGDAQSAEQPRVDEPVLSTSGLPVRRRGASLLPGSINEPAPGEARQPAPAAAAKDAGSMASTLSNLQRGVSRGREESGGWVPKRPSDPERSNS